MAFYSPLVAMSLSSSDWTHPTLQAQLRDGLCQAFPLQDAGDERFGRLLEALAQRKLQAEGRAPA